MADFAKLRRRTCAAGQDRWSASRIYRAAAAARAVELFELRRELNSVLIAHLKAEDWALYPRLIDSGDPQVAAVARAFSDEMGGLAAAFAAYNNRWSA